MKVIYEFFADFGRMGELEGLFVADKIDVENAIGEDVYFGEALGKHSEVSLTLKDKHFTIKSEDSEFVDKFIEILGCGTISGYNPIELLEDGEGMM